MFRILVFLAVCTSLNGFTSGRPLDKDATILKSSDENYDDQSGSRYYKYSYETSNGITRSEHGYVDRGELSVKGSYSYIGTDGKLYKVSYVADKDGFKLVPALPSTPDQSVLIRADVLGSLAG